MSRLLAAHLAVLVLLAPAARTRAADAANAAPAQGATPAQAPAPAPRSALGVSPALSPEADPAVRDLVRREVEKAKEDMREEMRAELQSQQSSRDLAEVTAAPERKKLDLLTIDGYLRLRSDLFDNFDLHRGPDAAGYYLFPRPLRDSENRGTLTSDNMRLRLEPTISVSEQVRVLTQIDLLDNIVLGSTPQGLFARSDGVQFPFDSRGQTVPTAGVNSASNSIAVKRAWAEVQTPLGLLSFGRMPSHWGLGMVANAGEGLDDNLGDSVDRLQFALSPISTPLGKLVLVPMYEIISTGVTSTDLRGNDTSGSGQIFDRDPSDDAKAIGLKVVRLDTDDEMKRKWDRGEASVSWGLWYMYKSQQYDFPTWANGGATNVNTGLNPTTPPSTGSSNDTNPNNVNGTNDVTGTAQRIDAYAHQLDFWFRRQTKKHRIELEIAGVTGQIGTDVGSVLLRQFGGVLQTDWKVGKFTLGGELGMASGDSNPGFGNQPLRGCVTSNGTMRCSGNAGAVQGVIEGQQFAAGDRVMDIRNFRFNPAYRIDLILFREILGGVTDVWYVKPTARWDILEGFGAHGQVVYTQAMKASSTPSQTSAPLGIEFDLGLDYKSDDGFVAWLNYGLLQPLSGLGYSPNFPEPAGRDVTRAHAIRLGLAVKF